MRKKRWLILIGTLAALVSLTFLVAACGGDDDNGNGNGNGDGNGDAVETRLEISAVDSNSFSTDSLVAPAGQSFTIVFDNQDSAETHNIAVYTDDTASERIDATDIELGPIEQELDVSALDAGEYYFQCDVHPTTMTGTLVVQ